MATVNGNNNSTTSAYSYLQFKNKIGGLVSGMDIDSIMEKLMKAQSAQMEKLQQQKQKYEWKRDAYRETNTKLNTYQQDLFDKYALKGSWNAKSATVSDNSSVTVKAGTNASGNLNINQVVTAKAAQSDFENKVTFTTSKMTGETPLASIGIDGQGLEDFRIFEGSGNSSSTSENKVSTMNDVIKNLSDNGYNATITNGQMKITATSEAKAMDLQTKESLKLLGFSFNDTSSQSTVLKTSDNSTAKSTTKLSDLSLGTKIVIKDKNEDILDEIDLTSLGEDPKISDLLKEVQDKGYNASFANGRLLISSKDDSEITVSSSNANAEFFSPFSSNTSKTFVVENNNESAKTLSGSDTIQDLMNIEATDGGSFTLRAIQADGSMKDTEISYKATDTINSLMSKINSSGAGVTALFSNGQFSLSANNTGDNKEGAEIRLVSSMTLEQEDALLEAEGDIEAWYTSHKNGDALFNKLTGIDMKYTSTGAGNNGASIYTDKYGFEREFMQDADGDLQDASGKYLDIEGNVLEDQTNNALRVKLTNALDHLGIEKGLDLATNGSNASMTVNNITYEQSSNVFNIAGYDITASQDFNVGTLNETTGVYAQANSNNKIFISSTVDADKSIDKVKEFVTMYNDLIAEINKKTTEKRNVDYSPLTDAQKAEMTESQIEKWEEKAKAGLLKGDTTLTNVLSKMRQTLFNYGTSSIASNSKEGTTAVGIKGETLASIGIATSKTWSDNGKLEIDEDKLRAALEKDPDIVSRIFTGDGTKENPGVVSQLRATAQEAVKTIEKSAGKDTSASDTSYSIGKTINTLSTKIDDWKDRLKDIEERYWKQFSAMETAIQKANSQSSMFMQ